MMGKIPELFHFGKRQLEVLRDGGGRDIAVGLIIILVGGAGFGLGRLSVISAPQAPLAIEGISQAAGIVAPVAKAALPTNAVPVANGQFIASKNGRVYHLLHCPGARNIAEANKIWFATKEEAASAGYRPASNCKGI